MFVVVMKYDMERFIVLGDGVMGLPVSYVRLDGGK